MWGKVYIIIKIEIVGITRKYHIIFVLYVKLEMSSTPINRKLFFIYQQSVRKN